jgi:hypothetical protein
LPLKYSVWCSISPALFAIAMEPLATLSRVSADIAPVKIKDTEHNISHYADDVLLFLSKSKTYILPLLNLIDTVPCESIRPP